MNEQLPKSPRRKLLPTLGIVGVVIVILVSGAIGKIVGRQGAKAIFNRGSQDTAPHFAGTAWTHHTIQDISLDAPFDFEAGLDVTAKLPQQARDAIDYFETYLNRNAPSSFAVMVSRIAYKPHIKASLDGAMKGGMSQAVAAAGDSNPQYSSRTTSISGIEARTASYQRKVSGRTMHIDAVFACRGQKLWQVQIIYLNDASAADASRILRSITIRP